MRLKSASMLLVIVLTTKKRKRRKRKMAVQRTSFTLKKVIVGLIRSRIS